MKNLFLSIVCIGIVLMIAIIPVQAEETGIAIAGDADLDGEVRAGDALRVLQYIVGKTQLTEQQLINADFTYRYYNTESEKGVDSRDALLILQYVCHTGPFKMVSPFQQ